MPDLPFRNARNYGFLQIRSVCSVLYNVKNFCQGLVSFIWFFVISTFIIGIYDIFFNFISSDFKITTVSLLILLWYWLLKRKGPPRIFWGRSWGSIRRIGEGEENGCTQRKRLKRTSTNSLFQTRCYVSPQGKKAYDRRRIKGNTRHTINCQIRTCSLSNWKKILWGS